MAFTFPIIADFKAFFVRDFPYGVDPTTTILDGDIQKGLNDALHINQDLFGDQTEFNTAYLNLSAHYLVMSIRASAQGIFGQYNWFQASKGVGSVSESFSIPQRVLDHPVMGMIAKTHYGAKFLTMILPRLSGQMFTVCGVTKP